MKRRILYVERSIGFGGAILSLSGLLKGLLEIGGVEPFVLSDQEEAVLAGLFPSSVRQLRARFLLNYRHRFSFQAYLRNHNVTGRLKRGMTAGYAVADWASDGLFTNSLERVIGELGIHQIHCNNGWDFPSLLAAKRTGVPAVLHYRSFPPDHRNPRIQRKLNRVGESIRACIGISKPISRAAVEFGHPSAIVHTIHNPVDVGIFQAASANRSRIRETLGLEPHHVVYGFFGRVTPWKGQLEFLDAVLPLMDRMPNLRILIVGDASDSAHPGYLSRIQDRVQSPGFRGRVIMTGYQRNVEDFYAAVEVVVHNSVEPEPFGRVVLEGMASGRAVLAMAEGGPAELIVSEENGLLVEPRNRQALTEAIGRLYHDPALRDRLARNARDAASSSFSPREIAEKVLALYR